MPTRSMLSLWPFGLGLTLNSRRTPAYCSANRENGKLIGAQLVGEEGATLRCNFASMAAHLGLTVQDFSEIETCYSPPLAPVWDPVTIAAQALLRKLRPPLTKAPTTRSNS